MNNNFNVQGNLPAMGSLDAVFQTEFTNSPLNTQMTAFATQYDDNAIQNNRYLYVKAKDVVVLHNRTPRSYRRFLLDEFRANRVIVQGMNLPSPPFPAENGIKKAKFKSPWYFVRTQPFENNVIYVYVDASVKHEEVGWSYLIIHNGILREFGVSKGPKIMATSNSHWAELKAINLGLRAAIVYINMMGENDRRQIIAVVVRCDSQSAVNQCIGSSVIRTRVHEVKQALWDIFSVSGSVEVLYFQHIDRELNEAANFLADHARRLHRVPNTPFNDERFRELYTSLINRDAKLCYETL